MMSKLVEKLIAQVTNLMDRLLNMVSARDLEKLMARVTKYMMNLLARELQRLGSRVLASWEKKLMVAMEEGSTE